MLFGLFYQMGSQQCRACEDTQSSSSAYGCFEVIVEDDYELALIRKTIPQGLMDKKTLERELSRRRLIHSPNIIKLHSYDVTVGPYLMEVQLRYEYVPMTLREKSVHWMGERSVSEAELANLLLGVECAILDLHRAGIRHRLVNLDTILCQKSLYKLVDTSMITFLTGLDLARQGDQGQLLSQRNLIVLNNEGTKPDYGLEDDLFSLALVVLVLVLRCSPKDFYWRKHNRMGLNQMRINEGLKVLGQNYDPWVSRKVKDLLNGSLKSSAATSQETPHKVSVETNYLPY